jgi:hypothetical protein
MRVLRKFEPWEEMFIRLTHPVETTTTIAKYLGRKNGSIREFVCRKLQTKKIDKIQIKIGDKFGILEVKSFVGLNKKRSKIWNCLCECGKSMTAVTNTLTSGHSKSCGCQRLKTVSKNYGGLVLGKLFNQIKRNAKTRGLEFNVSIEYLEKLFIEQNYKCKLSGLPIYIDTRRINYEHQKTTASLDRIDSLLGYIQGNLQWVHVDVNYMKLDHNQEYFIFICKAIACQNA